MQEKLQRFGGYLAAMVIPNIGAFMAWGLITALVIPTGWLPRLGFGGGQEGEIWGTLTDALVGPMIVNLLPILIAFTGGKMIHGHRGGVLGAVAIMGAIGSQGTVLASDGTELAIQPPQFLGAMIIGPLSGWV